MKKQDLKNFIKEVLSEEINPQDKITMDVPLFIRALEYAKEDAKTDMDLHDVAEKAIAASEDGKTLTMADYNSIFSNMEINEDLDLGHEDNEPHMIKGELYRIGKYAMELYQMVDKFEGKGEVDFPAWWQAKVTTSMNNMISAKHYLDFELKEPAIDTAVDTLNEADYTSARSVAKAFKEDILDPMKFGTDANERDPLIKKYIEDNEIKGIDPEEVVVELNDLMDVNEKKLTTAEKNKKEEIVKSMKKDFKGNEGAIYAIATDKAKKMAETIAKKLKEGNLGHNESASIHQEGNSWIVAYKNINGTQEKVFKTEKEAREFFNKFK
jgi:hypothetical protein